MCTVHHWMLVGGEENERIEQVKLIVLPGFTNTADFPCITAAAAEIKKRNYDRFINELIT